MANIICFDLEGPLSPQDNAYEVMGLLKEGHKVFEVLSRYDDILTLEGRQGYEPGDTLSLIIPFLVRHMVSEEDIRKVSDTARIVDGVPYTIERLNKSGWDPHIISTSYQQHAYNIASKIGVPADKVYCTRLALDANVRDLSATDSALIEKAERDVLKGLYTSMDDEKKMKDRLDRFFWNDLPRTAVGKFMREVRVVGGQRKLDAVFDAIKKNGKNLCDVFAVGDSITDYKMLRGVDAGGGVSIVFNGNQYSVPYATVGLASTDMRMILVLTEAWMRGGKQWVVKVAKDLETNRDRYRENPEKIPDDLVPDYIRSFLIEKEGDKNFMWPYFHHLEKADKDKQEEVIRIHKKARSLVRGDAAKLG